MLDISTEYGYVCQFMRHKQRPIWKQSQTVSIRQAEIRLLYTSIIYIKTLWLRSANYLGINDDKLPVDLWVLSDNGRRVRPSNAMTCTVSKPTHTVSILSLVMGQIRVLGDLGHHPATSVQHQFILQQHSQFTHSTCWQHGGVINALVLIYKADWYWA